MVSSALGGLRHDVTGLRGQAGALELHGGVLDAEFFLRNFFDAQQNALALIHVHIGNARVEAESDVRPAERPDVDVVHFVDAFDLQKGSSNFFDAGFAGAAFEEDVGGFAKNTDAGPENEHADGEAEERVDPVSAGETDGDGAGNDGDIRKSVAKIVDEDAAEIEIAAATNESKRDAAVDGEGADGSPDHPAFDDFDGRAEAIDRFPGKPGRQEDKEHGIGEGGESAGAMVAVGFFAVGGTRGPKHGEIGDAESGNVRKIVDGVIEKGDAVPEKAADDFDNNE